MNNSLIIDASNIFYMCKYRSKELSEEKDKDISRSLTLNIVINMIKKYWEKFDPDELIIAFDRHNWRVDYTKSDKCVSGKIYKGNRHNNLTEAEKEERKHFIETISIFEEFLSLNTTIKVLSAHGCEADDLIARYTQNNESKLITILSTDKDYVQLITSPNIKVYNPVKTSYITLEEYNYDLEWHKFFKFIRAGEDGIQSAYPRVRKTKLEKAYNDNFEMVNLLNYTWSDQDGNEFVVKDLYNENKLLMDLTQQPEDIKQLMDNVITEEMNKNTKFSNFEFLRFCGKHNLKNIQKYPDKYMKMFNQ